MSCAPGRPAFRLLDPRVGWATAASDGLTGLDSALRLAPAGPPGENPAATAAVFGDPRLARGCGPDEWYAIDGTRPAVLRLTHGGWIRTGLGGRHLVAIAARGRVLAVADRLRRQVDVFDGGGEHRTARLDLDADPVAVAIAPWGDILVAVTGSGPIRRFGPHGEKRSAAPWAAPPQVLGMAFAGTGVLLLTRDPAGALTIWRAERDRPEVTALTLAEAAALTGPSGVAAVGADGFCLGGRRCWSWAGQPVDDVAATRPQPLHTEGQLLTRAIDSGRPDCRWHRLRADAEVPPGATVRIAVATSETGDTQPAKGAETGPRWAGFPAGIPHPGDWQELPAGAADALIDRPPGRYLFVRVRLTGDGTVTPVVHGIRLDFPRATSLDRLPEVWQDDRTAAGFTARFLSLFDGRIEDLDRVIERYPALLDAAHVPDAILPWLAGLLGLGDDPGWSDTTRRTLIRAAPELYRLRGTPQGLRRAVELVFGVVPVIEELGAARAWGALSTRAVLGSVRLFGPSRVRLRLNRSTLGRTPIRSLGDPRLDVYGSDAYRFRVLIPPAPDRAVDVRRLEALVRAQAPAHTVATVRIGGSGLVVGRRSVVGVDTLLVGPPAPVLGPASGPGETAVLNHRAVLRPGTRRANAAIRAGDRSVVGINMVVR
ncbi:phage tail protein [Nonomuraea sp. NPDC050153]|uniref:phage tail protein n=1 Tax=Nonomuraea sp. NPDC050153 TaxID=3364359 RepID=UPI00378F5FAF